MPTIPWNIGPNELDCEVEVEIYPGDRETRYDGNNEGCPESGPRVVLVDTWVIENGKRRRLTNEEDGWLDAAEAEIAEAALAPA